MTLPLSVNQIHKPDSMNWLLAMEHTANSSPENKRYNDEMVLLDGLYEFHPDFFERLSLQERRALQTYYLIGQDVPENIFVYRAKIVQQQPELETEARTVLAKVCREARIKYPI